MQSHMSVDVTYDAGPTGCGELIMNLFLTMRKMGEGEIIKVISYDPGAQLTGAQHLVPCLPMKK